MISSSCKQQHQQHRLPAIKQEGHHRYNSDGTHTILRFLKDKKHERIVCLDQRQLQRSAFTLQRNDWVSLFHRHLRGELITSGVDFEGANGKQVPPTFEWQRFFEDALELLLISGTVPFDFDEMTGEPHALSFDCDAIRPIYVLTSETIRSMRYPFYGAEWMVARNMAPLDRPVVVDLDFRAFVFVGSDAPNIHNGKLRSIALTLTPQCLVQRTRITADVIGTIVRTNPPLLLQRLQDSGVQDAIAATMVTSEEEDILRDDKRLKAWDDDAAEFNFFESDRKVANAEMEQLGELLMEGVIDTPSIVKVRLPAGREIIPYPVPPPHSEFDERSQAFLQFISSAFGIPLAILTGDFVGSRQRAVANSTATTANGVSLMFPGGDMHSVFERYLLTLEKWERECDNLLQLILRIKGVGDGIVHFRSRRVKQIRAMLTTNVNDIEK